MHREPHAQRRGYEHQQEPRLLPYVRFMRPFGSSLIGETGHCTYCPLLATANPSSPSERARATEQNGIAKMDKKAINAPAR